MIKAGKANLFARLREKKVKEERKAEIEETYAQEIDTCEQAIKAVSNNGGFECVLKGLVEDYDAARSIEWYLEQFGYRTNKEKNYNGPGYNIIIKWYA